ncbi:hypothetical protein VNO78_08526 [Psophocarpus tetragonolobus]|uniref:Uncharacterized protein n=1 Tax=Psophocarpus tetragonolobus TaxID=3891 RepID=A0AAN9SXB9_PSOTE
MASMYHVRSNSFPSGSHPSSIRIEEELGKMKKWEATSTSSSESIGTYLKILGILDVCGITRNIMSQVTESVQALHSALGRRKADSKVEKSVAEYNFFTKRMKKNAKKFISFLKQMET